MLTQEQIIFYHEHGFLHIPQVFTQQKPTNSQMS